MNISEGKEVSIEYTLKLSDQTFVESNVGAPEPLKFTQGSHQIIPGLEKGLEGMQEGESKQITVPPEEGFGMVDHKAFVEMEKEKVPADLQKPGMQVQAQDQNGKNFVVRVTEIKDATVVLDFNHPLAGKTLCFDVKVLSIK